MFLFLISTLLDSQGEPLEGVHFTLKCLKEKDRKVALCGVCDDRMAEQLKIRNAGLGKYVDYYFCESTYPFLKERILGALLLDGDSVLLGMNAADKRLAEELNVRFCLATYRADMKDLGFDVKSVEMISSPKKLLTWNGIIYQDEKMDIRDYAVDFAGFSRPVMSPTNIYDGDKVYLPLAEVVLDEASNIKVLHVRDFITLLQAIDKIKKKIVGLIEMLKDVAGDGIKKLEDDVIEGLFQQYEQSSRWIDAVDNIWVALWFACHRRWEQCNIVRYVPRNPRIEKPQYRYCYIMILEADPKHVKLMDLRVKTPSIFVRPHAQHGVLLQKLGGDGTPARDMSSMIKGVVRVDLEDALSWIGDSLSLSASVMFPNPSFDSGFKNLIEDGLKMKTGLVFK